MNSNRAVKHTDSKSRVIIIAAVCIVAVVAAIVALVFGTAYSQSYVACVGNEKITVPEFRFFFKQQKEVMLSIAGSSDTSAFWDTMISGEKTIDIARRKALDSAKEFKIYLIKAKDAGLALDQADNDLIQKSYDSILELNGNSRTKADDYTMSEFGIDLDEYRQIYSEYLLTDKLKQDELGRISPTDDESRKRYDEDASAYDVLSVRHILFLTVDANTGLQLSEERLKEAEDAANEMLSGVKAGEDMEQLAKQFSEDPPAKENGGLYTFDKSDAEDYDDVFAAWTMDASEGDTAVIESSFGYHVMRLEKRESPGYEAIKDRIADEIKTEIFEEKVEEWINDPEYTTKINYPVYDSMM